ncbi:MAG: hypothetical protein AMXMBFR13_40380 [Phycisphaerae bacterium]
MATANEKRRRVLLIGGAALALVCIGVVGFLARGSSNTPGDRTLCGENLEAIGRACASYANTHQGNFPPSLSELAGTSGNTLTAEQLTCPNAGKKGRGGDFVYVPGYRSTDSPDSILVYEPLGNHKRKPGGHVLLLNGTVKWLTAEQHATAMAQVKAHQARVPAAR